MFFTDFDKQFSDLQRLANLRPETVIAAEGVSFTIKAGALPGVERISHSISDVSYAKSTILAGDVDGDNDIDVEDQMRLEPDCEERMVVMEKFIVAGGLCYDDDSSSSDPMEDGTGNGNVYHRGRRAYGDEEAKFYEAIGYNRYGDKDFTASSVCEALGELVWEHVRKDKSLRMVLHHMLRRHHRLGLHSVESAVKWAANAGGSDDYVVDAFTGKWAMYRLGTEDAARLQPLCGLMESLAEAAWDRAIASGTLGNPLAVMLDIYEHGGISYSVCGQGMQCQWDTTHGGAVWVPCNEAVANIEYNVLSRLCAGQVQWFGAVNNASAPCYASYSLDGGQTWVGSFPTWRQATEAMIEASGRKLDKANLDELMHAEAVKYCSGLLESYNDWRNGEVYGAVVYVIDRVTGERIDDKDDECWGYLGSSYAEEKLDDAILSKVLELGKTIH